MASCTNKVGNHEATQNLARNEQQNKEESVSFVLKSNDTPGRLLIVKVDVAPYITQKVPGVVIALGGGNASASPPVITFYGQALPIIHHRDTTVPHRLSSFFTAPSR